MYCVAVFCSVRCGVLQCVAVCCSMCNTIQLSLYLSLFTCLDIVLCLMLFKFVLLCLCLASLKGRKLWLWVAVTAPSHMSFHATVTPPFLRPRKIEFVVCKWFVDFVRFSLVTHWAPPTDHVTSHQDNHSDVTSLGERSSWHVDVYGSKFVVMCPPVQKKLCLPCGWRPGAGCLFNHGCICIFIYIYMVWAKNLLLATRSG